MATVADLRPCGVSLVRVPFGRDGAVLVCERRVAPSIRRINARYLADPRSHQYPIRPRDTGGYNCRKTRSGSSWSKHSYGCAEDLNWLTNGYGAHASHDMPMWFVQLWLDEGWGWGGFWIRVKDYMHFSKFPNEGGDGKLEEPGEEDDLAQVDQGEWDQVKKDVAACKKALFKSQGTFDGEHLTRIDNMLTALGAALPEPIAFKDNGTRA